jgi:hypothetical protein
VLVLVQRFPGSGTRPDLVASWDSAGYFETDLIWQLFDFVVRVEMYLIEIRSSVECIQARHTSLAALLLGVPSTFAPVAVDVVAGYEFALAVQAHHLRSQHSEGRAAVAAVASSAVVDAVPSSALSLLALAESSSSLTIHTHQASRRLLATAFVVVAEASAS